MIGFMDEDEAQALVSTVWDSLMNELPSKFSQDYISVQQDFICRRHYIKRFGYVLINREMIDEMVRKLRTVNVTSFIELQAGTGFLSKVLIDAGLEGRGYSLPIPDTSEGRRSHWGLEKSSMYNWCVDNSILELRDIQNIHNLEIGDSAIISSWIPYKAGEEVIEFFDNNQYPEWYILIGEGRGGCTANDTFFTWLGNNYEEYDSITTYDSFSGIYDRVEIYKKI